MPETPQEKPLNELLSRSMVDIYVGPTNTHWVLHEKLLCHHSPFFRKIFYSKTNTSKSYGLPDEEDATFKTFVGWLYSSSLPIPREESDLSVQFDLYLLSETLQIPALQQDILQVVREWYKYSDTYPGLRRVQYIYANTEEGSPMRHMLVHSVARMLVLEKGIPQHWDKALKKNGQLAVDIIRAIQEWGIEEEMVPDAREEPGEAEELVEDEEDEGVDVEAEEEEEGVDADGDDEGLDSSEDTVVESPVQQKAAKGIEDAKSGVQDVGRKIGDEFVSNMEKLGLKEVPNTISLDDYGTLH